VLKSRRAQVSLYSLRSRDGQQSPPVVGPPEVIPCRQGTSREGTRASNSDAQTTDGVGGNNLD
jgi:hypothetical protein